MVVTLVVVRGCQGGVHLVMMVGHHRWVWMCCPPMPVRLAPVVMWVAVWISVVRDRHLIFDDVCRVHVC